MGLHELEQQFWEKVWRCTHRHPCKRCCWPYIGAQGISVYDDLHICYVRQRRAARVFAEELGRVISAHLYAYAISKGAGLLTFPGRLIQGCHSCDYGHCCNPEHVSIGAQADNARDKRGKRYGIHRDQYVIFPDGRRYEFHAWRLLFLATTSDDPRQHHPAGRVEAGEG